MAGKDLSSSMEEIFAITKYFQTIIIDILFSSALSPCAMDVSTSHGQYCGTGPRSSPLTAKPTLALALPIVIFSRHAG